MLKLLTQSENTRIFLIFVTTLLTLPLVYSITIYVRPAMIIVYADDYPDQSSVVYNLTLKNNNDFTVNVTLTTSSDINNYVQILENA